MMNKTFRNLGFGFIGLILVMSFIKIPSYPDVSVCNKARDVCELKSRKLWQSDYYIKKSFSISDIKSKDCRKSRCGFSFLWIPADVGMLFLCSAQ